MNIAAKIAKELEIQEWQVEAVVTLIDEGNTIPFIARYRKEKHGSLDDEQLRALSERLTYLRNLEERKEQVLSSIEEQGKLTDELKKAVEMAETLVAIEDIYRPYKQKRRTRATIAKEKGLEPLAELILAQTAEKPLEEYAAAYVSEEKEVASAEEAIAGACDIIAEQISDNADYRTGIRNFTRKTGIVVSQAKNPEEKSVYEMYYDFQEPVSKIVGHRVLAINRGEKEKLLTVRIDVDPEKVLQYLGHYIITKDNKYTIPVLISTINDSYKRLIAPAIEREIRNELTEMAEDGAIKVFNTNLEQLLMQPPIAGEVVLGWDPGYRNGCKLAVVDVTGKILDTAIVYPTAPTTPAKIEAAKRTVKQLIKKHHVTLISCGNGTASRESEQLIVEIIKEIPEKVQYVITSEAGASIYSASKLAAEELPDYTVEQRSAASIARRVQDPLAELVKIDPKSIGVGQYQHDMNQKKLGDALTGVVEDCVNHVGVDLNTASAPLMEYISGISKTIAKNIVAYREENGRFRSRRDLLKVPKLGPKAFEQCAGFMRIAGGKEPLDNTAVHPESYAAAEQLLESLGMTKEDLAHSAGKASSDGQMTKAEQTRSAGKASSDGQMKNRGTQSRIRVKDTKAMAEKLGIGEPTLKDIIKELSSPGRDPREDMPKPILRSDVLDMKDLKVGMVLKGTVRNVIDFGAFVDIGVHQDGLVHVSQLTNKKFVKHPLEVVSVGDIVEVKVINLDLEKNRIGLSMIL